MNKTQGAAKKLQNPPAKPIPWRATAIRHSVPKTVVVTARTWFLAREMAVQQLGEPASDIAIVMLHPDE